MSESEFGERARKLVWTRMEANASEMTIPAHEADRVLTGSPREGKAGRRDAWKNDIARHIVQETGVFRPKPRRPHC